MKNILNGHKVRFSGLSRIDGITMGEVRDPDGYLHHRVMQMFHDLAEKIHRDRPDVYRITGDKDGGREIELSLYVFTHEELKELAEALRTEPGDIAIDGRKI